MHAKIITNAKGSDNWTIITCEDYLVFEGQSLNGLDLFEVIKNLNGFECLSYYELTDEQMEIGLEVIYKQDLEPVKCYYLQEFKMIREQRYLVFKYKDLDNCLTQEEFDILYSISVKVDNYRDKAKKRYLECVVVEDDWPEYEKVWEMLEQRIDKEDNNAI